MPDDLRFSEIEHKFVVGDDFDLAGFRAAVERLDPTRTTALRVRDRYFLTEAGRRGRFILRHRYDSELHHLTLKSLARDTEVRSEVNLDLGHHAGDQAPAVDAFVERLGVTWRGVIVQDLFLNETDSIHGLYQFDAPSSPEKWERVWSAVEAA